MMELQRQGSASESAKLLAVWRSVNSIRQDFNTTNNSTAKDLDRMRSDLSEWSCEWNFKYFYYYRDRTLSWRFWADDLWKVTQCATQPLAQKLEGNIKVRLKKSENCTVILALGGMTYYQLKVGYHDSC